MGNVGLVCPWSVGPGVVFQALASGMNSECPPGSNSGGLRSWKTVSLLRSFGQGGRNGR